MAVRIDIAMAQRRMVQSRSRAKLLLREGKILLNGRICTKPSEMAEDDDIIEIVGGDLPFVGRGGCKLAGALDVFHIVLAERICLDIGSSTGGFTDCMLQNGASLVYAVDVGHDQLDARLREDKRVRCMEGTDIRDVAQLPVLPSFCSIDVSFISLRLVLPEAYRLLEERGSCVALIKPQFEAGKSHIGKQGIVRSAGVHRQVLKEILAFAGELGFSVRGLCPSPIRGGSGNAEYLLYLSKSEGFPDVEIHVENTVRDAGLNGG